MLPVLGNERRELQAAVSQAKKREREKSNPEKKGCALPNHALGWKSFYSCLLSRFSPFFFTAQQWVSVLGERWVAMSPCPALPDLQVGSGLLVAGLEGELSNLSQQISLGNILKKAVVDGGEVACPRL